VSLILYLFTCRLFCDNCGFCVFSKNVSAERPSSERSKRSGEELQNKRCVDREHDGERSSRDSDHDRLFTYDRQTVCMRAVLL